MSSPLENALQSIGATRFSRPGADDYTNVTTIWAASASRPQVVIHCATPADVQAGLRVAREAGLPVSVRAGGHDWVGRALCDGVVLDLTPMRSAEVSADRRTIKVGGGARGVDVYGVTDPLGLVPVSGTVGLVGVAGLTLGGGYGPLIGLHGLACDNVVSVELVLADGTLARARADENADLFWALRGGGGNFGVVTALELRLFPLASIYSGMAIFPYPQAKAIFNGCADYRTHAPHGLDIQVGIIPAPDGSLMVAVTPSWIGDPAQGEALMAPILAMGTAVMSNFAHTPYGVSRNFFDAHIHLGLHTSGDGSWFPSMSPELVDILLDQAEKAPSPSCSVLTHDFHGAATEIAADATPFGLRTPHLMLELVAQTDPAQGDGSAERQWVADTKARTAHLRLPGGYPNMMAPDDPVRVGQSYGPNAERLRTIKRKYDPDGVFRATALPLAH